MRPSLRTKSESGTSPSRNNTALAGTSSSVALCHRLSMVFDGDLPADGCFCGTLRSILAIEQRSITARIHDDCEAAGSSTVDRAIQWEAARRILARGQAHTQCAMRAARDEPGTDAGGP